MHPSSEEKSKIDPNGVVPQDNRDFSETIKPDTHPDSAISEVPEDVVSEKGSNPILQADFFRNLLLSVSVILVAGTTILQLDLVPSVLLGCAVIGFNYFWTIHFVRKLLLDRKLLALDLLFILTKFGISVIVLFGALKYFELSPRGLLIGLSNVAIATIIYSFLRVMNPQKFA